MMTESSLVCLFIMVGPGLPGPPAGHASEISLKLHDYFLKNVDPK